jgi:drug/metabolite transporter (DMT)-like permease
VPADALALALAAAVVHAVWNVLLAGARDVQAATAVALLLGTVLFAVPAALERSLSDAAVPYLAVAAGLQAVYIGLLAAAYARTEMSVIYPVARGSAPVFVLVATTPSLVQALGVLVVVAGVIAVRGWRRPASGADLGLALAIGACIAAYTVVDSHGVDHAGAVTYLELELGLSALLYAGWLAARGVALRPAVGLRTLAAGAGTFGAYGLTLGALQLAPAAAVAAVRETSVVFGVLFAAVALRERVTAARLAGAVVVAAGVALVAAG